MACYIHHKRRGFTLPEVLIVLAIISIISGAAIISYSGFRNYLRLRNSSREIVSVLSTARSMAINQNGYYRVGFYIDDGAFWIDEIDSFGNLSQSQVVHGKKVNEAVKMVSVKVDDQELNSGLTHIIFYPDSTAQNGTIYLRRHGTPDVDVEYYTIRVYPATARAQIFPNQRK